MIIFVIIKRNIMAQVRDTQRNAWIRTKRNISQRQLEVLICLCKIQTGNYKEIGNFLGRPGHTITGRIHELEELGHVKDSGARRAGCTVWEPTVVFSTGFIDMQQFDYDRFYNKIEVLLTDNIDNPKLIKEMKVLARLLTIRQ